MGERWDAYDRQPRRLEKTPLVRGEPIPDGVYHLVCDVAVRHIDGSYLLMRRAAQKPFGGLWELTAGGSALCGETPVDCARRELREETGIAADGLEELGTVVVEGHHAVCAEFLCVTDVDKNAVTLQEGETAEYHWVSAAEVRSMGADTLVTTRIQRFVAELRRADAQ